MRLASLLGEPCEVHAALNPILKEETLSALRGDWLWLRVGFWVRAPLLNGYLII